ncbi:Ankyrin repeat protein 1 [Giardia muris]|uniref:Ankyrin repeat protein 1 n=1 Tax=Giardia muris TaxID=5742 RepID=A0A4Z1SST5_GIAMU|nr:Ankyrin repeat protein 1 [Giardia muris]|eukprot:TNJ28986.1 Ankyrin repeat protein 1 [Giardia muris]
MSDPRRKQTPQRHVTTKTRLMRAAEVNNLELVQELLDEEAGCILRRTLTALMLAARRGFYDAVRYLVPYEAGIVTTHGTALIQAARAGHHKCLHPLREELGKTDDEGRTALMHAAQQGRLKCIDPLLSEVGLQDLLGRTALMYAAELVHPLAPQIVGKLLKEARVQDNIGNSALFYATVETAPLLLPYEAGLQNIHEETALMLAARLGKADLVHILLKEAGVITSTGTALTAALFHRRTDCLEMLIIESELELLPLLHRAVLTRSADDITLLPDSPTYAFFGITAYDCAAAIGWKKGLENPWKKEDAD